MTRESFQEVLARYLTPEELELIELFKSSVHFPREVLDKRKQRNQGAGDGLKPGRVVLSAVLVLDGAGLTELLDVLHTERGGVDSQLLDPAHDDSSTGRVDADTSTPGSTVGAGAPAGAETGGEGAADSAEPSSHGYDIAVEPTEGDDELQPMSVTIYGIKPEDVDGGLVLRLGRGSAAGGGQS